MSMPNAPPAAAPTVEDPGLPPNESPTQAQACEGLSRSEAIFDVLNEHPGTDTTRMSDTSTLQGLVYQWLVNDDPAALDPCNEGDAVSLTQRYGLVSLFLATNGESWSDSTGWQTEASECNWFGVTCDAEGVVTGLNLGTSMMECLS